MGGWGIGGKPTARGQLLLLRAITSQTPMDFISGICTAS